MTKKIKILKGGPYLVSADVPLKKTAYKVNERGVSIAWNEGEKIDTAAKPYCLCRCGRSKTKPFCDGAHENCEFHDKETADNKPYMESAVVYEGPRADLYDKESLCAVARFCDDGEQCWYYIEKDTDEALEKAVYQACNCPAGRLTVVTKDGKPLEPKLEKEIALIYDTAARTHGPLFVKGGIEVEGAKGVKYETRNRMTLCRCGESDNMPFCDASHLSCPHMKER